MDNLPNHVRRWGWRRGSMEPSLIRLCWEDRIHAKACILVLSSVHWFESHLRSWIQDRECGHALAQCDHSWPCGLVDVFSSASYSHWCHWWSWGKDQSRWTRLISAGFAGIWWRWRSTCGLQRRDCCIRSLGWSIHIRNHSPGSRRARVSWVRTSSSILLRYKKERTLT